MRIGRLTLYFGVCSLLTVAAGCKTGDTNTLKDAAVSTDSAGNSIEAPKDWDKIISSEECAKSTDDEIICMGTLRATDGDDDPKEAILIGDVSAPAILLIERQTKTKTWANQHGHGETWKFRTRLLRSDLRINGAYKATTATYTDIRKDGGPVIHTLAGKLPGGKGLYNVEFVTGKDAATPVKTPEKMASWVRIRDPRIVWSVCGTNEGTSGIKNLKNSMVCQGRVVANSMPILGLKNGSGKPSFYYIADEDLTSGVVDPDGGAYGMRDWKLRLKNVDANLKQLGGAGSTAKISESWEYSEGYESIEGKTPDGKKIAASLVDATDEDAPDMD